jgi:DUF4097 and DUF4098 domain-containing protein YvlB
MAGYPPPYPPPPPPPPPPGGDWQYQRRVMRDQARAQRDYARAQRRAYKAQMRGFRRSSIVGPLLMIAVGVIFLLIQTGRLNGFFFWSWYGRWWPLLLVGIGVILLIEWVFDRNTQRDVPPGTPLVRHTIGGGVVFLLILLVVAGVSYTGYDHFGRGRMPGFVFNPDNLDQFFGDKHESDQSLDQSFPANGTLNVNNPHGDVNISGTSDDGQIHINVHKQVFSRSDSDAEKRTQQLNPQISTSGSTLNVSIPSLEGVIADLTITVPGPTPVTVTANHGDVKVSAIKAAVSVTANHGDVELSAITGPAMTRVNNNGVSFSARSITGSVTLEGHARDLTISNIDGPVSLSGDFFGDTHLEHIRGAVKFHTSRTDFQLVRLDGSLDISSSHISADDAQGPVNLTTRSRDVTLERISGDLAVSNSNGSVELTSAPPLGNVTVENRRGSVNLTVPTKAAFTVQAQTTNGDIQNDFNLPTQESNSRKNFVGTVGKGGSVIRINTSDGDIALKKADLAPLPPAPPRAPITPEPPKVDITGDDGSSVYIGKDGVRIVSGSDGSKIIVGKDGLKITKGADGSSAYKAPDGTSFTKNADGGIVYRGVDGTTLNKNADGSINYHGVDGTRYTKGADGGVAYIGPDRTRINVNSDGTQSGIGPDNRPLNEHQIRDRLHRADDEIRKVEREIEKVERQRDHELERQK